MNPNQQNKKFPNKTNSLTIEQSVESGRVPPQSIESEMCALGSMVLDNNSIGEVIHLLNAECFYRHDHQVLFEAMLSLYENNMPVDLVTLREELVKRGKLDEVGGVDYLVNIAESVPSAANAQYYAQAVLDKALLRNLITATNEINSDAFDAIGEVSEILEDAERKVFEVTEKKITRQAVGMRDIIQNVFISLEKRDGQLVTGIPTGYTELDEMTCGLQPGEMVIIAARPSMGKTALGLNIAEHVAADNGIAAAVFSLEMSSQMLAERMLAGLSHVDSQKLRRGMLSDKDYEALGTTAGGLSEAPLFVDDSSALTPLELRAKARRLKMQHDIQLIVIDYMQLMHAPGSESRQQEVGLISRHIKAVARELEIPIIAMAQLNRGPEGRDGHKPRMSDLRESGNIEQDADVVMLLHREGYYKKKASQEAADVADGAEYGMGSDEDAVDDTLAEIIIEKQRNGPTGVVQLTWIKEWTRFENRSKTVEMY